MILFSVLPACVAFLVFFICCAFSSSKKQKNDELPAGTNIASQGNRVLAHQPDDGTIAMATLINITCNTSSGGFQGDSGGGFGGGGGHGSSSGGGCGEGF